MIWLGYLLCLLGTGVAGLLSAGLVATRCVDWYRISSFEGKSGYFIISVALLGALIGFAVGLTVLVLLGPTDGRGLLKTLGCSIAVALGLAGMAYGFCWRLADIPPKLDGRTILLEIELMLPVNMEAPPFPPTGETSLRLHSVVGRVSRNFKEGQMALAAARMENGRWIVPGAVELYTMRGKRSLAFVINGQELMGYQAPLPARPSRAHLQWSPWGPRPRPPAPAWPDSQPSYRFRIQPV